MLRLALVVLALATPHLPSPGPLPHPLPAPTPDLVGQAWTFVFDLPPGGGTVSVVVPFDCRPCSVAVYVIAGGGGGWGVAQNGVSNYSLGVGTALGGVSVRILDDPPEAGGPSRFGFALGSSSAGQVFAFLLTSYPAEPSVDLENATVAAADEGPASWWRIDDLAGASAYGAVVGAGAAGRLAWTAEHGAAILMAPPFLEAGVGSYAFTPHGARVCSGAFILHNCGNPFAYGAAGDYETGFAAREDVGWQQQVAAVADVDTFGWHSP